jgi:peptide-methionine (R)-S-oxide reductase
MLDRHPTRRDILATSALAGAALALGRAAQARPPGNLDPDAPFQFEVQRSEPEWRARLDEAEFQILREGGTEWPASSPLWNDYRAGEFFCRGCDLHLYGSDWRAPVEQGFVFFYHAHPNAVLTAVEFGNPYLSGTRNPKQTLIEVHCRRCGSHLGHIVHTEGKLVHCINGTSLAFTASAA